jgi:hypothetical protein
MKAKDERISLEKILDKSPATISKNVAIPGENTPELQNQPIMDIDFNELKIKCDNEAKAMILNSVSFSLPKDMIENNEYLKNKIEVDALSLSGMIYQLRCNEAVQKALMDQINLGITHPRIFEVFSGMSKTIGDLNKQLLQTVEAIQSTYKGIKENIKEQRTEALGPSLGNNGMLTAGDGSVITRGTKELINRVKEVKNQKNMEDVQFIPDVPVNK